MAKRLIQRLEGNEMFVFCGITAVFLFVISFFLNTPVEIAQGMKLILTSRDALITDYFALANYGAAFFNAALVLLMGILIIWKKVAFTGLTMAVLFINIGFALFGKNPINVLPIILGTYLYARLHKAKMSRYIYTALFGSCLAPLVTEMVYILPCSLPVNLICAVGVGIFIGFVLPPLSMHTASMHMGYNLFNVGFSAGLLAFVAVCIFQSFGWHSGPVFIWKEGRPLWMVIGLYGYFIFAILYGIIIGHADIRKVTKIFRHPGRAVADFVLMDGAGITLVNMGIIGSICTTYILLIGGDLSGPVVGAILTAFGFAAFGVHAKNYLPVLAGVYLSTFINRFTVTTPGIQMGAIFAVALAPIAGQFGAVAGIVAGILHAAVVMCTSQLYEGLNLYNNGFSTGLVAIIMVPMLESFMKHFKYKKRSGGKSNDT